MLVIYIAGPFRGAHAWAVEQNVRRAELVAYKIFAAGHVALCPHTNTRFFDGALPDQIFIDGTLELLRRCDGVIVLPQAESSRGTQGEIAEAVRLGMPVEELTRLHPVDIRVAVKRIHAALEARAEQPKGTSSDGEEKED